MTTPPKPMLATDSKVKPPRVPEGPGWTMEPKLDGWRFIWVRTDDDVLAFGGRNGADHTGDPGAGVIREALMFLPPGTVLDTELIAEGGIAASVGSALSGTIKGRQFHLRAFAFDVLQIGETDVTGLAWSQRRQLLEKLSEQFDVQNIALVPSVEPSQDLHERWVRDGLEGSVCKRMDSIYRPGRRSPDWPKFKPQQTTEALILNVVKGEGEFNGDEWGAFEIQLIETGEETSTATANDVQRAEIKADPSAFVGKMIEIRHHGWTADGKVKHPVFSRMRPDRDREGAAA